MYQPAHARFVETRPEVLHRLVRNYPLGTLLTQRDGNIEINHSPFLLDAEGRSLASHVPRANSVWQELDGKSVQIVFHGPNAYVSPSWYATKQDHGKVVPTWNYAVVHVSGTARAIEDTSWLRAHLDEITNAHERGLAHPWKVSDAPVEYLDKMLGAIVGVQVVDLKFEGKFKLSQNRPEVDREGVASALSAIESPVATLMRRLGEE